MDVCEICDAISELSDAWFIQVAEHVIQDLRCRLMRHAGEDVNRSEIPTGWNRRQE